MSTSTGFLPWGFTLDVGCATDVGRLRDVNEDAVWAGQRLFAVADGMGGHAAGEVASGIALDLLAPLAARADLGPDDLTEAIARANSQILDVAVARSETAGMGTTVTGVYLGEFGGSPHWFVFNVGDSRVYRYIAGALAQVTVDHSEVEELIESGAITAAQARAHPRRNVITRSLGTDPAPVADIRMVPAVAGDAFVICSDGLPAEVSDTDIELVLRDETGSQSAANRLCRMAVDAGGRDNVSVIVVRTLGTGDIDAVDETTAPRPRIVGKF